MKKQMNNFKRLRLLQGMTAIEASEALGIPVAVYYHYESGARLPNIKRLQHIAKFYGVTIDELLPEEE